MGVCMDNVERRSELIQTNDENRFSTYSKTKKEKKKKEELRNKRRRKRKQTMRRYYRLFYERNERICGILRRDMTMSSSDVHCHELFITKTHIKHVRIVN
jgi:predicted DNA-binding transcriptional regulator YafY